ncbi:MAG: polysaccharide deacetylase [Selenomonadaceae bacterium]|nr:polysaccharide deacetylase [Selenomonadaceae bacterium]
MKKFFYLTVVLLLTICLGGCGEQAKETDVNDIPTEVATGKVVEPTDDGKSDETKPAESKTDDAKTDDAKIDDAKPEVKPTTQVQAGKDYVVADDNLSNLQLADPTIPVYDKYTIWERQEKGLPVALPQLTPYEAESVVYLTFDDGPDDKVTPQILDILKSEGVKATFYVCGNMVDANPTVLKRIFDEGYAIGNHSYNHNYNQLYASPWSFMEQIIQTDNSIKNIIGVRPFIIRAPGGAGSMFTTNYYTMVEDCGYVEHDWNVLTEDATPSRPNASQQINNVLGYLGENPPRTVILLMHSNGDKGETVKALPEIIHFLRDWGYKFGVVTPMTPQPW